MKFLLLLSLGSCLALHKLTVEERFDRFKVKYAKEYSSVAEEKMRFDIFTKNIVALEMHNKATVTYTKGINEWSDMAQEEWESVYLGGLKRMGVRQKGTTTTTNIRMEDLPASVDWREQGIISDVKNQGACGSCWAFGTTEQIESYTAISSGTLVELSAQQVNSCAPNAVSCGGTGGCQGSTPPLGYSYVQLFGQIAEADYPYMSGTTSDDEDCAYDLSDSNKMPVAGITGYDNLTPNNQEAVINHIANVGPLAISVAANTFKDYNGGVFTGCDYDANIQLNHAVQLVGYGSDFSPAGVVDYWLVRNSWGENWGENGYIKLLRETNPKCGMDTATTGHVCQGGPGYADPLHVCGMCGMLFETSFPLGAHLL